MNTSFVPSLHHLSCSKLVASLFNHHEVQKNFQKRNYEGVKRQVTETISRLTPSTRLREQLEKFIDPLFREIEEWLQVFASSCWYGYDSVFRAIKENIPQCWLSDGTIDREKSAKALVKNKDLKPINRFVFACTFCLFDDVLALWKILFKIEKAYLRHKSSPIVKHWVEWLENSYDEEREFFVEGTLATPLWHSNVYILKHSLETLSPAEKSQHLLKALIGKKVCVDVMRFCISVVTEDVQEMIFRESAVEVFKCISSWPLRSIFFDIADGLWPYLTEESFCDILFMFLLRIDDQVRKDVELIILLKTFWAQSPRDFQNIAKDDARFAKPLQFILDFDVPKVFPAQHFTDLFTVNLLVPLPRPQLLLRRRRRRGTRRRYRTMM